MPKVLKPVSEVTVQGILYKNCSERFCVIYRKMHAMELTKKLFLPPGFSCDVFSPFNMQCPKMVTAFAARFLKCF